MFSFQGSAKHWMDQQWSDEVSRVGIEVELAGQLPVLASPVAVDAPVVVLKRFESFANEGVHDLFGDVLDAAPVMFNAGADVPCDDPVPW
ncbi:hypothetical protein SAMN03159444_03121 [Pseudomonas sp. NFACC02]|uniref:hypothetical protein n=1 Tax=Pseudomonas sp. NFACC02 TaxID=1566250 RepID=UPI0008C6C7CF|nr:hypothetical protein [Pseudomonas sp. NFACC02]SER06057.1 hypothetical protein SAMN03159444_03121 [Pseudomonas sp. NFACC02]